METKPEVGKLYRSTKNGRTYRIIALGKHSETLEDLVVYEAQYDNAMSKVWIRPLSMFFEIVEREGKMVPRFVPAE